MALQIRYRNENNEEKLIFSGGIDESTGQALSQLGKYLGKDLIFDLGGINYLNSLGVRMWVDFLRHYETDRRFVFQNCSPEVLSQINIFPSFVRSGVVHSVYVPFICEACGHEKDWLITKDVNMPKVSTEIPIVNCPACRKAQPVSDASSFDFIDVLNDRSA